MTPPFAALLFDIDGTLVRAGGAGRRAFEAALEDHAGAIDGAVRSLRFDGMTDRGIVREALRLLGRGFDEATCDALLGRYLELLPGELAATPGFLVLPGVVPLLSGLAAAGASYGLCTGNVAEGARLKLRHGRLDGFFDWGPGGTHGFAADGEERHLLVAAAVRRVGARLGRAVAPAEVLIVGDTPRDVAGAHEVGCPCLCVATGNFDEGALRAAGADLVVPSLDAPAALDLLRS